MTPPQPRQRIPVTVLGATGVVGQRFVRRLANHPWFRVDHLAASERSAGQRYGEACAWRLGGEPHGGLADLEVRACDPSAAPAPIVFSALDSGPAKEIEPAYARAGSLVFSNASAFRMAVDVPLLVPEVNADHLDLVDVQREARDWSGAIVTNPNCTSTVLVMALAPLHRAFGVEKVFVATMQATSGAGYPGVPSLDILSNVVPHISGEEEKVETETQKMLGTLQMGRIVPAAATVSAMCHRVPVIDGHTEAVSVQLRGNPAPEEVAEALRTWSSVPQEMQLPSAPTRPILLHGEPSRPQPRLDVEYGEGAAQGMAVHVGRVRRCPMLGVKFTLLGHNTERGAAGASVLNAELAHARGRISL